MSYPNAEDNIVIPTRNFFLLLKLYFISFYVKILKTGIGYNMDKASYCFQFYILLPHLSSTFEITTALYKTLTSKPDVGMWL